MSRSLGENANISFDYRESQERTNSIVEIATSTSPERGNSVCGRLPQITIERNPRCEVCRQCTRVCVGDSCAFSVSLFGCRAVEGCIAVRHEWVGTVDHSRSGVVSVGFLAAFVVQVRYVELLRLLKLSVRFSTLIMFVVRMPTRAPAVAIERAGRPSNCSETLIFATNKSEEESVVRNTRRGRAIKVAISIAGQSPEKKKEIDQKPQGKDKLARRTKTPKKKERQT
ncbi:hypothetical protein Tco_1473962 [Tanacetum coccineum]